MSTSGGKTKREQIVYSIAIIILASAFLGLIFIIAGNPIGYVLVFPFILLLLLVVIFDVIKREKRCVNCGKLLPKNSMFLDYCIECAKKKEMKNSRN